MPEPSRREPRSPRAKGRRIALVVYYALVVCIATPAAVQITLQIFFEDGGRQRGLPARQPPETSGEASGPAPLPPDTCHQGLRALFESLARAREAAAGSEGGEYAALARFRQELEPEWIHRDGVASRCQGSPKDAATLDAIERLRYAEENAVRREAGELAPLRRKVQAIVDSELGR
jgi:hypothetical protein